MPHINVKAIIAKLKAHRFWAMGLLSLVLLLAGYLGAGPGGSGALAASMLLDPLSVFAERSPGLRGAGALAQTKLAYARARPARGPGAPSAPSERVLSNVRSRPAMPAAPLELGSERPLSIGAPLLDLPVLPDNALSLPLLGSIPGGSGGSGPVGFPAIGSTGGVPGGSVTPPSAVPAVPEPATWLSMFVGFFFIGFAVRSQRRREVRTRVACLAATAKKR